jgi:hypothetical protein
LATAKKKKTSHHIIYLNSNFNIVTFSHHINFFITIQIKKITIKHFFFHINQILLKNKAKS